MSVRMPGMIGRLATDPQLRHTAQGQAFVKFVVATETAMRRGGRWVAEEASLWRCTAFDELAVNIAESLRRGHRVFVCGVLKESTWSDGQGNTRRGVELIVEDCGPSLKAARATVVAERNSVSPASDAPWAV